MNLTNEDSNGAGTAEDIKAKLIDFNYFNGDGSKLITETIIERINYGSDHLFRQSKVDDFETRGRIFRDEGHAVAEPLITPKCVLQDLKDSTESFWFCGLEERTEKELFDTKEPFSPEKNSAQLKNVPPLMFSEVQRMKEKSIPIDIVIDSKTKLLIEFTFGTIKFNHHPLFSLEHALASCLTRAYESYADTKSKQTIKKIEESINVLRHKKRDFFNEIADAKKIFQNQEFRKCIKDLKKLRASRINECSEQKRIEKSMLYYWKGVKAMRKKSGITNTGVVIQIKKQYDEDGSRARTWEENIEEELKDVIDELKCNYYEKRVEYNKKLKKKEKKSEKLSKPTLEYDEDQIREELNETFSDAKKSPDEPILHFKLTNNTDIITKVPTEITEINRRKNVNKTKVFLKIWVNNKMVCKTNLFQLRQDFTVHLDEQFKVELNENLFIIKVSVFEKRLLNSVEYSDIIIPTPKESTERNEEFDKYSFCMAKKAISNKCGVGSGIALAELLKSELSDFSIEKEEELLNNVLYGEGSLEASVIIPSESGLDKALQTINNIKTNKKSIDLQYLTDLFKSDFDPNDPENSIIATYFQTASPKITCGDYFYLNSDLFLKFNLNAIDRYMKLSNMKSSRPSKKIKNLEEVIPDNISNQVDFQRQKSVKYLQSLNAHFSNSRNEQVEKKIYDVLIDVKYPSIRSIALDILHPKKPLFYQSRKPSTVSRNFGSMHKEYLLKICIFKAFHLPNRLDNDRQKIQDENEETFIKMVNLRPYISVNCQGQTKRTTTVIGNNPTWNEEMTFTVKNNVGSILTLQLFDEVMENWLADERLEESTVHYHYNLHWLGSLRIPLSNIFSQSKMDGTFLMHSPIELLGYKHVSEEKYPNSQISFDALRKELLIKQREDMFISMYIELLPAYAENIPAPINVFTNSNEIDSVLQHLIAFGENYKNQFPDRKLYALVMDSNGKHSCFTRFFQSVPLMDLGDCIKKLFVEVNKEASTSSKNSTPFKRKASGSVEKDIDRLSISLSDKRRPSKSIKEIFDVKSLSEQQFDDFPISVKMQICIRYVSMIPTYKTQSSANSFVVLTANQVLKLACGSMVDHTILLMGYFMQMGIECWCIAGVGVPYGLSTYVLIREEATTNDIILKQSGKLRKSLFSYKKNYNYYIFDATLGLKYNIKNPFAPLQRVHFICNHENIWANVQNEDRSNLIRLDLDRTSDWRPVFLKGGAVTCPQSMDSLADAKNIYSYKEESAKQLRDALQDKIKKKVQKWRGHRKTIWNRYCSKILKDALIHWEKWNLNTLPSKPKYNSHIQQLLLSYEIFGFPLNMPYTTVGDIILAIKGTQLHLNEDSGVEFGLGIEVFTYPNHVYSVWVFFASIRKK